MIDRSRTRIADRPRPRRWSRRFTPLVLAVALLAACSPAEEDPAAAARRRMLERLEETFSGDQAACILDELDPEVVDRLLEDGDLAGDDTELWIYSAAVRDCVITEVIEIEPPPGGPDEVDRGDEGAEDDGDDRSDEGDEPAVDDRHTDHDDPDTDED